MGCWNESCMLSNLPIFDGDDVKLLFLLENNYYRSRCDSTFQHRPFPFIINGKYNDYGDVENIDPVGGDFVLKTWFSDFKSWDQVFEVEHDDKLIINDVKNTPSDCRHVMIRSDVYNATIPHAQFEPYDGPPIGLSNLIEEGITAVEELFNAPKNDRFEGLGLDPSIILSLSGTNDTMFFRMFNHSKFYWAGEAMIQFNRALMDGDQPTANKLVEMYAEMIMLMHYLETSRKSFYVPSGSGSQESSTKYQQLLAEATLKVAEDIDTRWDDEEA